MIHHHIRIIMTCNKFLPFYLNQNMDTVQVFHDIPWDFPWHGFRRGPTW